MMLNEVNSIHALRRYLVVLPCRRLTNYYVVYPYLSLVSMTIKVTVA